MRSRFSGAAGSDSLELLLDTLCNVFGGIVLIACLVAILPRANLEAPSQPTEPASSQLVERRIAAARAELLRLDESLQELPSAADPARAALQARRDSIRRALADVKERRKGAEDEELAMADAQAMVARFDPKALQEKLDRLQLEIVGAENLAQAGAAKIEFLEERLRRLGEEGGRLGKSHVQAVRFPRERGKKSSPFPVVVRYGQIYPLVVGAQGRVNPALKRTANSRGGFSADPIRGQGAVLPESRALLLSTLSGLAAKGLYVTIYLYPDSHETLQSLKDLLGEVKVSYGLDFMEDGKGLTFSSEGSAPPEL